MQHLVNLGSFCDPSNNVSSCVIAIEFAHMMPISSALNARHT